MKNKKGFTLMEMLVVVAVIAILVAIAIPVISNSLERSREAKDLATLRYAYAKVAAVSLTNTMASGSNTFEDVTQEGSSYYMYVDAVQNAAGWVDKKGHSLGEISIPGDLNGAAVKKWKVLLDTESGEYEITAVE